MNEHRQKRIEKRILHLLADLYFREIQNPDIGFTTFTRCQLSSDASHVKVFVSIYEPRDSQLKTLKGLQRSIPMIRGRIAKNIRMKKVPYIHFQLDESLDKADRMEALLSSS